MKDVTLNSGEVVTDKEHVGQHGDAITEFPEVEMKEDVENLIEYRATKDDLVMLADTLVNQMLYDENFGRLANSFKHLQYANWLAHRLDQVMALIPEHDPEVVEKLRVGREENKKSKESYERSYDLLDTTPLTRGEQELLVESLRRYEIWMKDAGQGGYGHVKVLRKTISEWKPKVPA